MTIKKAGIRRTVAVPAEENTLTIEELQAAYLAHSDLGWGYHRSTFRSKSGSCISVLNGTSGSGCAACGAPVRRCAAAQDVLRRLVSETALSWARG
jgi:hypothetical protein